MRQKLKCESVATLPDASRRRGLCDQGALVAANADFVCYSIKSSIRVIHRPTGARALIKMNGTAGRGAPQVCVACAGALYRVWGVLSGRRVSVSRVCFVVGTSNLAVDIRGGLGCGVSRCGRAASGYLYVFFYCCFFTLE